MRILIDESVSLDLARALRELGHDVLAVAKIGAKGDADSDVWDRACSTQSVLITRDYHFTNSVRFNPSSCLGIMFLRHGNLKSADEIRLVTEFLTSHTLGEFRGRLVTISNRGIRIR
jgi:predicted nuclease of predicted toxin-antitoxin system